MFLFRFCFELVEGSSGEGMMGAFAREGLPTTHDRIEVNWVELESVASPSSALRRDHGGAAAEKTVEHDIAPRRTVHDCIGHQRDRFYSWVQEEQIAFIGGSRKRIGTGAVPYIGTVAAELPELDVIS